MGVVDAAAIEAEGAVVAATVAEVTAEVRTTAGATTPTTGMHVRRRQMKSARYRTIIPFVIGSSVSSLRKSLIKVEPTRTTQGPKADEGTARRVPLGEPTPGGRKGHNLPEDLKTDNASAQVRGRGVADRRCPAAVCGRATGGSI